MLLIFLSFSTNLDFPFFPSSLNIMNEIYENINCSFESNCPFLLSCYQSDNTKRAANPTLGCSFCVILFVCFFSNSIHRSIDFSTLVLLNKLWPLSLSLLQLIVYHFENNNLFFCWNLHIVNKEKTKTKKKSYYLVVTKFYVSPE